MAISPRPFTFPMFLNMLRTTQPVVPARAFSDLKTRIAKCVMFGLSASQVDEAGDILRSATRQWRDLVAGSEGFITRKGWPGLEGLEVAWGDMVGSCLR